jgi:hypothetical protein
MILSRIPLMSYAIFLAVVANTISLAQAQAPPPPGVSNQESSLTQSES